MSSTAATSSKRFVSRSNPDVRRAAVGPGPLRDPLLNRHAQPPPPPPRGGPSTGVCDTCKELVRHRTYDGAAKRALPVGADDDQPRALPLGQVESRNRPLGDELNLGLVGRRRRREPDDERVDEADRVALSPFSSDA